MNVHFISRNCCSTSLKRYVKDNSPATLKFLTSMCVAKRGPSPETWHLYSPIDSREIFTRTICLSSVWSLWNMNKDGVKVVKMMYSTRSANNEKRWFWPVSRIVQRVLKFFRRNWDCKTNCYMIMIIIMIMIIYSFSLVKCITFIMRRILQQF